MIDSRFIGSRSLVATHDVVKSAIVRFAWALGDHDPIHQDEAHARARGFASIVAPPTFAFTLRPGSEVRDRLGLDWRNVLHGEQRFRFRRPIVAGDRVLVSACIADVYEKLGTSGTMDFVVTETTGETTNGEAIYWMRTVTVVRRKR